MLRLRWRELTTAAAFALLAVVFIVAGRGLALEARGIPGPGLFPLLVAATTLVFSAALVVSAVVAPHRAPAVPVEAGDDGSGGAAAEIEDAEEPDGASRWRRPMFLWVALLGCSLLMTAVGFLAAMVLLVGILLVGMERRRDRLSYLSVVAVPVAFYVLFALLLDVRLPTGPFG
jgi:hypothetical protein